MSWARGFGARGLLAGAAVWALIVGWPRNQAQSQQNDQANGQRNGELNSQQGIQQNSQQKDPSQSKPQVQGLAFWEPKPETEKALLGAGREKDPARYEALRKAFVEAGCTGQHLREETVAEHKEKNLFCVLPGGNAGTILVAARYDQRALEEGGGQWGDAVALPLLYRALEASPRRHTFAFAEIGGKDGEKEFLSSQADAKAEPVVAEVVMGGVGLGYPVCSAIKPNSLRELPPTPAEDLCRLAHGVAVAMRLVDPTEADDNNSLSIRWLYQANAFREGLFAHSPVKAKVVLWSEFDPERGKEWYGKDFDFAAWFLCWADREYQGTGFR